MHNTPFQTFRRIAFITGLLFLGSAQAHHVWIEQDGSGTGNAMLYFGEFGGNLRETSPGLLDKFVKPVGRLLGAEGARPLVPTKSAQGFVLPARAAQGESIVAEETAYPSFERKEGGKSTRGIYVPAARLVAGFGDQPPALTLDLVPTGQQTGDGVELQAFYEGKPLPKAKVNIVTAAGWSQEHQADAQGKLKVSLPWQGSYVLEIKHTGGPGERSGEKYDSASYVTSLTLMQTQGLVAPPAPLPATPNK